MKKNLVIVESPSKAQTISRFLGNDYKVIATYGHVIDLPKKELGVDTSHGFAPKYIVPQKSKRVIKEIKNAVLNAKVLYLATDYDREGEAIAAHIKEKTKPKIPTKRITFHEITKSAIISSIKHPREIDQDLVMAQQARRVLDRLVGYKLSPFLWRKVAGGLSAGRVQSVALRLIVDRENEIRKHKSQEYWVISAQLSQKNINQSFLSYMIKIDDKIIDKLGINSHKQSENIIQNLKGASWKVIDFIQKEAKRYPPPPYITSTLQQEASQRLNFTAKKTMQIAQQLYEGIKVGSKGRTGLITYMRTDSVTVAKVAIFGARAVIEKEFGKNYLPPTPHFYKTRAKRAQEAHEAIRPTHIDYLPEKIQSDLTHDQYRLYKLIWQKMVASQMKPAEILQNRANIKANNYIFEAKGDQITFAGFLFMYGNNKNNNINNRQNYVPKLKVNETLTLIKLNSDQKFTEPPARFTEATLIKELEKNEIGRPSTFAPTIQTIQSRGYVKTENRVFIPQEIGELVIKLLKTHFSDIVDLKFTAYMEKELDEIAEGKMVWNKVIEEFYKPFKQNLVKKNKEISKADLINEKTDEICDKCGKPMEIKIGKFGKFLSCSGYPECKNSKPIIDKRLEKKVSQEKCEKCGSEMLVKQSKFGEFLACSQYPKCKFTKQIIKTIGLKCPKCGDGQVIERKTRRGRIFWGCSTFPKCKWASWNDPRKNSKE